MSFGDSAGHGALASRPDAKPPVVFIGRSSMLARVQRRRRVNVHRVYPWVKARFVTKKERIAGHEVRWSSRNGLSIGLPLPLSSESPPANGGSAGRRKQTARLPAMAGPRVALQWERRGPGIATLARPRSRYASLRGSSLADSRLHTVLSAGGA